VVANRWTAAGAAGVLVTALAVPAVTAWGADEDDLKNRRGQVTERLQDARGDLGHSSRELTRAVRRLEAAQAELSAAQEHLAQTRERLADAVAYDRLMQQRLDDAEARLDRARAELAEGRQAVTRQRNRLAEFAAESFQDTDNQFLELRVFLKSETPQSLSTQMEAVDSISAKQSNSFARLKASEVLLKVNEEEVQAAKEEVAAQRAAAARNLERKQALEAEAQAAEEKVSELVAARESARREAQEAKEADLAQVEELEAEREEISDRLAAIARRRAAALARAQAAREAREAREARAAAGAAASAASDLVYPVSSYITSSYGMRFHPILHYYKLHDGTDFAAACGTPVRAAADGRVLSAYFSTGYGNQLLIDHGIVDGVSLSSSYNHLTSFAASPGEHVEQGEVVAYSGTTGYSTGCHLHFMVYENGDTVDPMNWL
jgi:murein DD-endopeptidase MepM/ murein hydrolase activator NlpD